MCEVMNKVLLTMVTVLILAGTVSYAGASDLPSGFDLPCPNGQSIIQEVCTAVNTLHDRIGTTEGDIVTIQTSAAALVLALATEIQATNSDFISLINQVDNLDEIVGGHVTDISDLEEITSELDTKVIDVESMLYITDSYIKQESFTALGFAVTNHVTSCNVGDIVLSGSTNQGSTKNLKIIAFPDTTESWSYSVNNNSAGNVSFTTYLVCGILTS